MLVPINSKVTFVSDGEYQEFALQIDSSVDMIEEAILDGYESYREESLCINGINVMFPNIKSGYMIIEGKIGEQLESHGKEIYFSLKSAKDILKLGVRKGDVLHLKGVSSLRVTDVNYGDRMISIALE